MKKNIIRAILFLLAMSFVLCACRKGNTEPAPSTQWTVPTSAVNPTDDEAVMIPFEAPEAYDCVLQVVMEPIANLYLDTEGNILAIQYLNELAQSTFLSEEEKIKDAPLENGIAAMMEVAVQNKVVGANLVISIADEEGIYANVMSRAEKAFTENVKKLGADCKITVLGNADVGEGEIVVDEDDPIFEPVDSGSDAPAVDTAEPAEEGGEITENSDVA